MVSCKFNARFVSLWRGAWWGRASVNETLLNENRYEIKTNNFSLLTDDLKWGSSSNEDAIAHESRCWGSVHLQIAEWEVLAFLVLIRPLLSFSPHTAFYNSLGIAKLSTSLSAQDRCREGNQLSQNWDETFVLPCRPVVHAAYPASCRRRPWTVETLS